VKAVGDLQRLRRACGRSVDIQAGPVTGDDLHGRVFGQPSCHTVGGAIGQ